MSILCELNSKYFPVRKDNNSFFFFSIAIEETIVLGTGAVVFL